MKLSKPIHPMALFRLRVLGTLAACTPLNRGELKQHLQALAARAYLDPATGRPVRLAEKTIERWYYA